jgi:hypothetical protein
MDEFKCPQCGSNNFYVKDPDDEYEVFEFDYKAGGIVFQDENTDITKDQETYCNKCAWHDKFSSFTDGK